MIFFIVTIFIIGYLAIAFEHSTGIDKASPALISGVLCWVIFIVNSEAKEHITETLAEQLGEYAGILFFLMGAMTIVEIIDVHDGFQIITRKIRTTSKRQLLWIISVLTFMLSPVLDNLTTAIVMTSLVQKLIKEKHERLIYVGIIVIASNAGGAWSPIGDVTTTMLWLGGQITAGSIVAGLLLPSIISVLVPVIILSFRLNGRFIRVDGGDEQPISTADVRRQTIIFFSGLLILIGVPVFKTLTHLPPYMGMLIGLGIMWIVAEKIGKNTEEKDPYKLSPAYALRKIDSPSILFFLGILLSIGALQATGVLSGTAEWLTSHINNVNVTVISMGLLSSIVDNVPLVAAAQKMFSLSTYPVDDYFWQFLAYSTGTGGSALIIGSVAGVAAMGLAKVEFFWYLKNISWVALIGFFAGALVFIAMHI